MRKHGYQGKHPGCIRVLLLACPTCHAYTSLPLTYEKNLGSRSLLLLNLISHYLPLKSLASTKRRLTTPESTVDFESTNDGYRMPPGLTLSVFLPPNPATSERAALP